MARSGRPLKVESELQYLDNYVSDNDFSGIKELTKRFGVNCHDPDKRTPLIIAAANGNEHMLKYLIELGADVNFQDRVGYSALHFAGQNRLVGIARILVDNGANPNLIDIYGNPPSVDSNI